MKLKESEKMDKYLNLTSELTMKPVLLGVLGTVKKVKKKDWSHWKSE